MPDPIAFVVMPFNRKPTGRTEQDVPAEIDFDALWDRVYRPVLADKGYEAVRADRDVGALIIAEMIQRLTLADLVVADITLPNANVYYEVGVRHAAKRDGCVLVGADWARPTFDVDQMRQLRFPLADGEIGEEAATAASAALREGLDDLATGISPVFGAVSGYPTPKLEEQTAFAAAVRELSRFQAAVRAIRATPAAQRRERVQALLETYGARPVVRDVVVLQLLVLVRDHLGFPALLDYIGTLPARLREHPLVLEQEALALSETDDVPGAIGRLEELIDRRGPTSERLGLLGGRYKRLFEESRDPGERRGYLDAAIDAYRRGMELDLNAYYPSSNLARLYRERDAPDDAQLANEALAATALACRAAIARGTSDEWVRPTLLGNAFDRGDVAEAIRLRAEVAAEGAATWKLDSTIADLRRSVQQQEDPNLRAGLQAVLKELEEL
jgi:hypothetical protein